MLLDLGAYQEDKYEVGELTPDEEMIENPRERVTRIWCQDTGIWLSGAREGLIFFRTMKYLKNEHGDSQEVHTSPADESA